MPCPHKRRGISVKIQRAKYSTQSNTWRKLCTLLDLVCMFNLVDNRHFNALLLGYHRVFQLPTGSASKLCNDNIAIAKKIHVKVNVVDRLMRLAG